MDGNLGQKASGETRKTTARGRARAGGDKPVDSATVSAGKAQDLFKAIADSMIAQSKHSAIPLRVSGIVGHLKSETDYGMIYEIDLLEKQGSSSGIRMDFKGALLEQHGIGEGDFVTAVGRVVARMRNGVVHLRLDVLDFEFDASPAAAVTSRGGQDVLSFLRSVPVTRRLFPVRTPVRIAVIHPGTAQTTEDFLNAVKQVEYKLAISRIPVNIQIATEVASAIRSADCDVLAIIRGGGDGKDFAVFDSKDVLEALGDCSAFKLLGVGHSSNRTIADLMVDHVADTPTGAGNFVREAVSRILEEQKRYAQAKSTQGTITSQETPAQKARSGWLKAALLLLIGAAGGAGLLYQFGSELAALIGNFSK